VTGAAVESGHPVATEHLPVFVTAPGQTDVLLVVMSIFLVAAVVGIGVLYFKLHSLPEQLAHRGQKVQFEIVAVLGLIALFTHNHLFWIAGLLLALIPLPDFSTPLTSMAQSLGRMAGARSAAHAEPPPAAQPLPNDEERSAVVTAPAPRDDVIPTSGHGS
jgi:hypothetical protein